MLISVGSVIVDILLCISCCTASILHLCVIAVERYLAITVSEMNDNVSSGTLNLKPRLQRHNSTQLDVQLS